MPQSPIRLHRVAELTPALMAELAAAGYRAVRDPELVLFIVDSAPVTLATPTPDAAPAPAPAPAPDGGPR